MVRSLTFLALATCSMALTGCCGFGGGGCGDGYVTGACGSHIDGCNGCGPDWDYRTPSPTPLATLINSKRSMVCGAGCGDPYMGEWKSHPPTEDPCCFSYPDRSAHCGTGCYDECDFRNRPRPLWFVGRLVASLYGKRYCNDVVMDSCGCGDVQCDGGCGSVDYGPVGIESGCSTCTADSGTTMGPGTNIGNSTTIKTNLRTARAPQRIKTSGVQTRMVRQMAPPESGASTDNTLRR